MEIEEGNGCSGPGGVGDVTTLHVKVGRGEGDK